MSVIEDIAVIEEQEKALRFAAFDAGLAVGWNRAV